MSNKTLIVNRGKFEAKVEIEGDLTKISFTIPKEEDGIEPNDFSYLLSHVMQLCIKPQEGKYNVFVDGVQTQTIKEKQQEILELDAT